MKSGVAKRRPQHSLSRVARNKLEWQQMVSWNMNACCTYWKLLRF